MLSNTLRLNFCYLKIIHILLSRYHPKILGHILKSKQKNKCVCIHAINHKENEDQNEKRSHSYAIKRPSSRHGHKIVFQQVSQHDDAYIY